MESLSKEDELRVSYTDGVGTETEGIVEDYESGKTLHPNRIRIEAESVDNTETNKASTTPIEINMEATYMTFMNGTETAIVGDCKEQPEDPIVPIQGPYAVIIKNPLDSTRESLFKNAFNHQGSSQYIKPICGKREQEFHTRFRNKALFDGLEIGFDELLISLNETVEGHLRGNGVYSIKYHASITSIEQFLQP